MFVVEEFLAYEGWCEEEKFTDFSFAHELYLRLKNEDRCVRIIVVIEES